MFIYYKVPLVDYNFSLFLLVYSTAAVECILQSDHKVCVCNATYCDTLPPIDPVPKGQYVVFTTSKDGQRFFKEVMKVDNSSQTNGQYLSIKHF